MPIKKKHQELVDAFKKGNKWKERITWGLMILAIVASWVHNEVKEHQEEQYSRQVIELLQQMGP